MALTVDHGEYKSLGKFSSIGRKVPFLHKACGETVEIKPRPSLFEGVRCVCESAVTQPETRKALGAHDGFELIRFTDTNDPVLIRHNSCGREFECGHHKFLNFPSCRACKPPHMTTELYRKRVRELTVGEYAASGEFVDQHVKIAIRYEKRGRVQEYQPNHFLERQRCHAYGNMPVWEKSFSPLEQCKAEHGSSNVHKMESYKGCSLWQLYRERLDNYKKCILTEEQIRRLEEIGFVWEKKRSKEGSFQNRWQTCFYRSTRIFLPKGKSVYERDCWFHGNSFTS